MPEFSEVRIDSGRSVVTGIERPGLGTPIAFLHGAGGNALSLSPMLPALGASRVLSLDLPGHGGSSDPPDWELAPLAESLYAAIRQLVKGRVIWGGHSCGGKLAAIIAATHPETAEALILLDPSPASEMFVPAEMFVAMTFGAELGPWQSLEEARHSVRNLPQYANWNPDLERAFERGLVNIEGGLLRARASRETLIALCAAAAKNHSATIRKVSCPTLVVVADESLAWQEQTNFAILPHATRAAIKSNHWLMSSNPADLNRAVARWLSPSAAESAHAAG